MPFALNETQLRKLSDRRFGVGCDQFLIVEPGQAPGADFNYRIFNADGGEVNACGNGARAFVRFVRSKGLTAKSKISVDTASGRLVLSENPDGAVTVDMGAPLFSAPQVPFISAMPEAITHALPLAGGVTREISVVNMGNPHAVQVVTDVDAAPVQREGQEIEMHAQFPQRANVGFMQVITANEIRLRVWERGVGETLACGTGACAAVVAGISRGLLQSPVTVHARGGDLLISWAGAGATVRMTGPAEIVFEGVIEIDD